MFRLTTILFLLVVGTAEAALISYSDRASFESVGTIQETNDFESFGSGFSLPSPVGESWISQGIEYTTGFNFIVGPDTSHNPLTNVFAYAGFTRITGNILQRMNLIDLFGFDIGYVGDNSDIIINLNTNLNSYSLTTSMLPHASQGLDFLGFGLTAGEFFTDFSLTATLMSNSAPVLDNVSVGFREVTTQFITVSPTQVSEPSTLALLTSVLLGCLLLRPKRNTLPRQQKV